MSEYLNNYIWANIMYELGRRELGMVWLCQAIGKTRGSIRGACVTQAKAPTKFSNRVIEACCEAIGCLPSDITEYSDAKLDWFAAKLSADRSENGKKATGKPLHLGDWEEGWKATGFPDELTDPCEEGVINLYVKLIRDCSDEYKRAWARRERLKRSRKKNPRAWQEVNDRIYNCERLLPSWCLERLRADALEGNYLKWERKPKDEL